MIVPVHRAGIILAPSLVVIKDVVDTDLLNFERRIDHGTIGAPWFERSQWAIQRSLRSSRLMTEGFRRPVNDCCWTSFDGACSMAVADGVRSTGPPLAVPHVGIAVTDRASAGRVIARAVAVIWTTIAVNAVNAAGTTVAVAAVTVGAAASQCTGRNTSGDDVSRHVHLTREEFFESFGPINSAVFRSAIRRRAGEGGVGASFRAPSQEKPFFHVSAERGRGFGR